MRKWSLAAGAACAALLTAPLGAQNTTTSTISGNAMMPGQVVSSFNGFNPTSAGGQVQAQVGQQFPSAAPQAGQSITSNPMMRPYDPNRPYDAFKGTNIDPNNVLAPLVGTGGEQYQPPDALERFIQKVKDFFTASPPPPRPPFTPGIIRRKKERIEDRMWRRD